MIIDQEVSQAYCSAVCQWVKSNKGRKRSVKPGRNFLLLNNCGDTKFFNRLEDAALYYDDTFIALDSKDLTNLGVKFKLDYVIFGLGDSFVQETPPTAKSFDEIENKVTKTSLLLRRGGCFVAALNPTALGFTNLALRNSGFQRNASAIIDLPSGFKAIRAIRA